MFIEHHHVNEDATEYEHSHVLDSGGEDHEHTMRKQTYVIRGPLVDGERLYWSNVDGWVARDTATQFSRAERDTFLVLPREGEDWEPFDADLDISESLQRESEFFREREDRG